MPKFKTLLALLILVAISLSADAQCAMCKAVAESGTKTGSTEATGLNVGILYLMVFPYLIMAGVGYAIYRHKKTSKRAETPQ
jgi:uncharacterized paraquat-inducible protein A